MKKRSFEILLIMTLIISFCYIPSYAISTPDQISQLEKEISDLEDRMAEYGDASAVIGTITATSPYFIVNGLSVGEALLNGIAENIIDNPEDGSIHGNNYVGNHKYLGIETIDYGNYSITYNHYGSMGDEWYAIADEKAAKQKQLDALTAKPVYLKESGLAAYTFGDKNYIVMQIGNPNMYAYGAFESIDDNGTAPIILNGSTLIPIRAIIESSGGTVGWSSGVTTITLGNRSIQLTANNTTATVNGSTVKMTSPAQVINSRLMVPIRFVAENLGMKVSWKQDAKVIVIYNETYTADRIEESLSLSNGYYTYTDNSIGVKYRYPEAWNKPTIDRTSQDNGLVAVSATFRTEYATIKQYYEYTPSDDELSILNNPSGDYEAIKLTTNNTGIAAITKTSTDYSNNTSSGEVYILGTNGYLVKFFWTLNAMDTGLSETQTDVLNVVNTLSLQEAEG